MLTRARFLRLGATATLGTLAAPVGARAALPTPTPQGDDQGFLQFGALTERTALGFYRRALRVRGFDRGERARMRAIAADKVVHVQRLTAALGGDAPSVSDYAIDLPASAFATRAGTLKLGRRLEGLLCGVYVDGVAFTADPATRLLLGRVLTSDATHLATVRDLAGLAPGGGLPDPIDLETAGAQLDSYLEGQRLPHPLMRRLLILLCLLVPAAVPAGARALNVSAAASLRNVLPALTRRPTTTSRAPTRSSARSSAARPPTSSCPPSPLRPRRSSARGCARARSPSRRTSSCCSCRTPTRAACARSIRCARAGADSRSAPPASRSATTRACCCAACGSPGCSRRTPSARSPTSRASPRRSRSGSADAGFVYHTDALASRGRTNEIRLPKYAQPAVRYQGASVRRSGVDARGAQSFIRLLRCTRGRRRLPHSASGCRPAGDPPRRVRRVPSPCAPASRWRS